MTSFFTDSGNFKSRSDYSGTGANSEPFVPRKPGSGKFKAMAAEVTIDLSFLQRSNDKSEPSKPVKGIILHTFCVLNYFKRLL